MEILNKTTNEVVTIKLIDPTSGVNMVLDYSPIKEDKNVSYNADTEQYEANAETVDWWVSSLAQYQEMEKLIYDINQDGSRADRKKLDAILDDNMNQEWNDRAGYIIEAIKKEILGLDD